MLTETVAQFSLADFGAEVRSGLTQPGQKELPSKYLYDEVGSALFEVITALPEYGLCRADERLLRRHAEEIVQAAAARADRGGRTGQRQRKEDALDSAGAGPAPADPLLPDRDFSDGAGAVRQGTGPDGLGQHRGLRAALSRRACFRSPRAAATASVCWFCFSAAPSAISTGRPANNFSRKCAAGCGRAMRCCWAPTWKSRCRSFCALTTIRWA